MSVHPAPGRVLRRGPVGRILGFTRSLRWQVAELSADFKLRLFDGAYESNLTGARACATLDLRGVEATWGFLDTREPALQLQLRAAEAVADGAGGGACAGCASCFGGGNGSRKHTLVLHKAADLYAWIRAIQILFANSEHRPCRQGEGGSVGDECTICLSPFEDGEELAVLTACSHRFHEECIAEWLEQSEKCPLCKKVSRDEFGQPVMAQGRFVKTDTQHQQTEAAEAKTN